MAEIEPGFYWARNLTWTPEAREWLPIELTKDAIRYPSGFTTRLHEWEIGPRLTPPGDPQ